MEIDNRGKIVDGRWSGQETLFKVDEVHHTSTGAHFGSRFVFDGGYLFFGIGDRGRMERAQELHRPNGKIYRIHDDGRVPADNPFVDREGALPEIWSYGHRNPQGLLFDSKKHLLWEIEHGPRGGDEINLIKKGRNYGWPVVSHGKEHFSLTRDKQKKYNKVHKGIQSLVKDSNVPVHVCGTYADWNNVDESEFPDYVDVAAAGPVQINDYRQLVYLLVKVK